MREKILALIKEKNERKSDIVKQAEKSDKVEDLRQLNKDLDEVNKEIRSLEELLNELPEEQDPADPEGRTAAVNRSTPGIVSANAASQEVRKSDEEADKEYRKAFQQYVTRGTPIPAELRANENTLTSDIASAVPTILVDRIVEKLESTGMILPLVNKTQFAAGVVIPTSSIKPVATWVAEGASSDRQKKATGTITFSHYKLRCEISMSAEASAMALSAFEASFVKQVSEAMTKAQEQAIISGNGTTQPKGILTETPDEGQALTAGELTYKLITDAEGKLPQAYEQNAVWCMTKATFMKFIGITDSAGQPIARINYGLGGKPERSLLGRTVELCGDYIKTFSTSLASGDIFAFLFDFSDYTLNTIYDLGVARQRDWDTEDVLTKAVMSVDGKVVDKGSLVTIGYVPAV